MGTARGNMVHEMRNQCDTQFKRRVSYVPYVFSGRLRHTVLIDIGRSNSSVEALVSGRSWFDSNLLLPESIVVGNGFLELHPHRYSPGDVAQLEGLRSVRDIHGKSRTRLSARGAPMLGAYSVGSSPTIAIGDWKSCPYSCRWWI
jgi:hypothetical protein